MQGTVNTASPDFEIVNESRGLNKYPEVDAGGQLTKLTSISDDSEVTFCIKLELDMSESYMSHAFCNYGPFFVKPLRI